MVNDVIDLPVYTYSLKFPGQMPVYTGAVFLRTEAN